MKYKGKTDMLEIANRNRNLAGACLCYVTRYAIAHDNEPAQWKAWLTHTRKDPPTLDVSTVGPATSISIAPHSATGA